MPSQSSIHQQVVLIVVGRRAAAASLNIMFAFIILGFCLSNSILGYVFGRTAELSFSFFSTVFAYELCMVR